MRDTLNPATPEVVQHCPRCGATEAMFKATVRLNKNPLHTSRGFNCAACSFYMEVAGWADDIEKENIIQSWEENGLTP